MKKELTQIFFDKRAKFIHEFWVEPEFWCLALTRLFLGATLSAF